MIFVFKAPGPIITISGQGIFNRAKYTGSGAISTDNKYSYVGQSTIKATPFQYRSVARLISLDSSVLTLITQYFTYTGSGIINFSGDSNTQSSDYHYTGNGNLTLDSAAIFSNIVRVSQLNIQIGGNVADVPVRVSQLNIQIGGNTNAPLQVSQFAVNLIIEFNNNYVGSGTITLAGNAGVKAIYYYKYDSNVDLEISGEALTEFDQIKITSMSVEVFGNLEAPTRLTQITAEVIQQPPADLDARLTQITAEIIQQPPADLDARLTQIVIEIIMKSFTWISNVELELNGDHGLKLGLNYPGSGTIILSGNPNLVLNVKIITDGNLIVIGGEAITKASYNYTGDIDLLLEGEALAGIIFDYIGDIDLLLSGDPNVELNVKPISEVDLILGGEALYPIHYIGNGTLILSGDPNIVLNVKPISEVDLILGGTGFNLQVNTAVLFDCDNFPQVVKGGDIPLKGTKYECGCKIGLRKVLKEKKRTGVNCISWNFFSGGCPVNHRLSKQRCDGGGGFVAQPTLCRTNMLFYDDSPCRKDLRKK